MKLEAGKWYRARDGRKAFVGFRNPCTADCYNWCGYIDGEISTRLWSEDGSWLDGRPNNFDLISEWTEPAVGSNAWANSLPVGTRVRWDGWDLGEYTERTTSGWKPVKNSLCDPGEVAKEPTGWLLYTEPKLRLWRHDEVPLGAWMTMEGKPGRYLITGAKEFDLIVSGIGAISYEQAFNRCKHSIDNGATWLPCGVADV